MGHFGVMGNGTGSGTGSGTRNGTGNATGNGTGNATGSDRCFLLLQGPHGPFFSLLGRALRRTGAEVWRVGFNAGDSAFWPHRASYIAHLDPLEQWPAHLEAIVEDRGVTDIVLYGDTRPVHAAAVELARRRGLVVHVFEEGYLRPFWVTYERGGSNGHSRLMQIDLGTMQRALRAQDAEIAMPPAHWGDMREHILYGALYHGCVLLANRRYRHFRSHRDIPVSRELRLHLRRLAGLPVMTLQRALAARRVRLGGFPYHVVLLQLEHDASFRAHAPFASMTEFLDHVLAGFARGAPRHHHLVVKAHPLEDGRTPLRAHLRRRARAAGLEGRVHFLQGGKLAPLLDAARSAVTVNSTAGQQALWRGLPLKAFGRAVYDKPAFVSDQPLEAFFAAPRRPDLAAYRTYRRFLLQTSQLPGGFYAHRARRQLLRQVVDMMLDPLDPYDALLLRGTGTEAPATDSRAARGPHLRLIVPPG